MLLRVRDYAHLVPTVLGAKGDPGSVPAGTVVKDPTTGLILPADLPVSQVGEAGKLAQYDDSGVAYQLRAGNVERLATRPEVDELLAAITTDPVVLAKVGALRYTGSPIVLNTDGSTYTPVPTVAVLDAASGEGYSLFPVFHYSGPGGIKIRRKSNGTATTNRETDPGFESGALTGVSVSGGATISVCTTDGASGSNSLELNVTGSGLGGVQVYGPWRPIEQGVKASTAGRVKRVSSSSRTSRMDAQYGDATASDATPTTGVLSSVTGANNSPGTDWSTREIMDSAHLGGTGSQVAPSGAKFVRYRWTVVSPVSGDKFRLDEVQNEQADTIPAFGSTGGSGGALSYYGGWYPDVPVAQDAGSSPVVSSFATTGAKMLAGFGTVDVGGTGLTGQHIEWEAAVATPGSATSITWAALDYARIRVPS